MNPLQFTLCLIVFTTIFYIKNNNINLWFIATILLLAWLGIIFATVKKFKANVPLYIRMLSFSLMLLLAFLLANWHTYVTPRFPSHSNVYWFIFKGFVGCAFLLLNVVTTCGIKRFNKVQIDHKQNPVKFADILNCIESSSLWEEQKEDLKRIVDYLDKFSFVGINGKWGLGKTYIVDEFKKLVNNCDTTKEKCEFLQIDLLSFDLDKVEEIIIDGIEGILIKNNIYSTAGRRIKKILGKSHWSGIFTDFFCGDSSSLSNAYKKLREDIYNLNKTIVINIEDIDRLLQEDRQTIDLILGIVERLTATTWKKQGEKDGKEASYGGKIKVICQYDSDALINKLGFNRDYLEKYIPYEVNLTPVTYEHVIEICWEKLIGKDTKIANGLLSRSDISALLPDEYEIAGDTLEIIISEPSLSYLPRHVNRYLKELQIVCNSFLQDKKDTFSSKNPKWALMVIARVLFVKKFLPKHYDMFVVRQSPCDSFRITPPQCVSGDDNAEQISIRKLVNKCQQIEKDFERRDTLQEIIYEYGEIRLCVWIICFLGLQLPRRELINPQRNNELLQNYRNNNTQVNEILWYVIAKGATITDDIISCKSTN